jgi:hypothetical protein
MRTLVCGSRDFVDGPLIFKTLDVMKPTITCVIAGGARGPDTIAVEWAKLRGVAYEIYPAQWGRNGKAAGFIRNREMIEVCEQVVAFWDGRSHGTKNTIQRAQSHNLPLFIMTGNGDWYLTTYLGAGG